MPQLRMNWVLGIAFFAFALFSVQATGQTYNTMIDNGSSENRVDMVFIGDGYQDFELESTYVTHINQTLEHFFQSGQDPFPRYNNFFNVHRVNIASNESGADDPNGGTFVDTALDASYNWGGTDRCLYFNTSKANAAVSTALSGTLIDVDMRLGAVNSSKYGGCGGQWAVWAGGNSSAKEIALHEIGHSFGGLADEYFSSGTYNGGEPGQPNVTADPDSGKWDRWVGYDDPDSDIGIIDYYEGGRYFEKGIWRPSDNSKMRSLNRPFDAISREQFINKIYQEVDPLDEWLDDSKEYGEGDTLWVDTVDPSVINVEWFVDGESRGLLGESIDIDSLGLSDGEYLIEARAYDSILDHSYTGESLDWWRHSDTSSLQQTVGWNVSYSAVPEPGQVIGLSILAFIAFVRIRRKRRGKVHHESDVAP